MGQWSHGDWPPPAETPRDYGTPGSPQGGGRTPEIACAWTAGMYQHYDAIETPTTNLGPAWHEKLYT